MNQLVDEVLTERRHRDNRRRRLIAGAAALVGHTSLAAVVALAPVFAAQRKDTVRDYMRVMIVPAKALGDAAAPATPAPAKPRPKPPKPTPTPVVKEQPKASVPSPKKEAEPTRSTPAPAQASDTGPSDTGSEQETTQRRGGPDGTSFGTSAFGSSEASFDDPNFMYGYYVQQMLALIGSHWARPRASPGTEMIIHFNIDRQGVLSEIEVVSESGNRAFDLAGFRAVALASPLPPLPQSYRSDTLGVNLVIR